MHLQTKPSSDAQTTQNWQQIVTFQDAIHHYPGCKRTKPKWFWKVGQIKYIANTFYISANHSSALMNFTYTWQLLLW
jgi:hypothetical protein